MKQVEGGGCMYLETQIDTHLTTAFIKLLRYICLTKTIHFEQRWLVQVGIHALCD